MTELKNIYFDENKTKIQKLLNENSQPGRSFYVFVKLMEISSLDLGEKEESLYKFE